MVHNKHQEIESDFKETHKIHYIEEFIAILPCKKFCYNHDYHVLFFKDMIVEKRINKSLKINL
jgi:hypothetical protein